MAGEVPDPKTFSSWEEAFQHPIPAVRGMEKQLRRDIDSNKEKLRTLVGASYRGLLNTAESIIEMDSQMHNVEAHMAEIGQKCNMRLLEKKTTNFNTWQEEMDKPGSADYALASQLSVLRSCPDVISRLLKGGGSLLLAAKVLVVSRLLHTKLSKRPRPLPYLEVLRGRLAVLRRKLLSRIDRRFKILDVPRDVLLEAMCAFVLATSSSPTDVVRHFLHLRLEAITECMSQETEREKSALHTLRLYVRTMKDTQTLLPSQLAHALERIKMVSIFKSNDLQNLIELNLDVYERWIDDDIKTFTPYIRHDDLSRLEAEKLLKQWARTAISRFLEALGDQTQHVQDAVELMQMRKQILELWLSQHQHALGVDPAETLDGLRDVFNLQALRIIGKQVSLLEKVSDMTRGIARDWQAGQDVVNLSLWDPLLMSVDATNGAKRFCDAITDRLQGKNEPFARISSEYTQWLESISAIEETIKSVRETKWTDALDDVDDDGLLEDKQILLSKDDPLLLEDELSKAITAAHSKMESALETPQLLVDTSNFGQQGVFLLRVWRDLRHRLPTRHSNSSLGLHGISRIEDAAVEYALKEPLNSCSKRLNKLAKAGRLLSRSLWEGSPELPVLPSPWTYRLLVDVVQSMSKLGVDIWSPHLSAELKKSLSQKAFNLLQRSTTKHERNKRKTNKEVNGDATNDTNGERGQSQGQTTATNDDAPDDVKEGEQNPAKEINGTYVNGNGDQRTKVDGNVNDFKIQRLFDVLYLTQACTVATVDEKGHSDLYKLQASLKADLKLETKPLDRLTRNAEEYWKRTKLLFALL